MKTQHWAAYSVSVLGIMLLAGCASHTTSKKSDATLSVPVPTYTEKLQSVPLEQVLGSACPENNNQWKNLEWKKILPLANTCVKTKRWLQLETIGNFLAVKAHLTPWGAYYLGIAAEAKKDYPRAIWMLELALKKAPGEGLFHYELGRIYWELKDDSAALTHLKTAADLNPGLSDAHLVMGQMALQRQDLSVAEKYLNKCLAGAPQHWRALLSLAAVKVARREWLQAEGLLGQVVKINPQSSKGMLALAQVQEEHLKKLQDALRTYRQLRQMAAERKLDETVNLNLEEKIQTLEKSIALVSQADSKESDKATGRQPTGGDEGVKGQVKQ